jgi:hypothetical protein
MRTRRKKNLYFGFGPASKQERERQRSYVRPSGGARKTKPMRHRSAARGSGLSKERSDVALALEGQGYKKAEAQKKAAAATGGDFSSLFRSALKKNPHRVFPGDLTAPEVLALQKLARGGQMATKKRRQRKKKNPRKGVMPPGLRKYWAKKRAKKKNPAKKKRKLRPRQAYTKKTKKRRRRKLGFKLYPVVRGGKTVWVSVPPKERNPRKKSRRRRRRPAAKRRGTVKLTPPRGLGPKGLRQYVALARKAYPNSPVRIVK